MCFVFVCIVVRVCRLIDKKFFFDCFSFDVNFVSNSHFSIQSAMLHLMISHVDRNFFHQFCCVLDGRVVDGCFLVCFCGNRCLADIWPTVPFQTVRKKLSILIWRMFGSSPHKRRIGTPRPHLHGMPRSIVRLTRGDLHHKHGCWHDR